MVRTLARFHRDEVRDALLGKLADPHGPVREAALEGLASLQLPVPVEPICQLLRDPASAVRRQASRLLAQRQDPQTVVSLFDVLQDPSPEVYQGAVELLAAIGDASIVKAAVTARADTPVVRDTLMRLLAAPQTRVRQLALEGLASLPLPLDVDAVGRLLWDPDRTIREQATALLTQLNASQTLPVLIEALQAEAADVRQTAVTILNAIGEAQIIKELLSALRDKEWWVTMRVTDALGRGGGAKVVEAALQLSLDEDTDLRRAALEILKLIKDPQVPDFLVAALDSRELQTRTCAAEAIAALGEKRAVPALLRMAQTGDTEMGLIALRTLTTLGDTRAMPVCLAYLRRGSPEMQQAALQALATLTDAEHSEAVLQAVMAVRSTNDATLKALANSTASALIRRFGERAVGRGASLSTSLSMSMSRAAPSMSRAAPQSLLYESTPDTAPQAPAARVSDAGDSPSDLSSEAPTIVSEPMLDAATLEAGMLLAERYRVIRRVGQGGFGMVMLVEDMMIREQLILKFLNPQMAADERMIQRFIHELRYARRVTHENVIRIHDFLCLDKAYAISMEYFLSHDLSVELRGDTPMDPQRGLRILWHICRGMNAAHQVKIVHRDLKPPNVLINDAGIVKIVDFGLAAAASDTATRLTRTGALLGTPLYMAPEQVQNRQIDARTDIYSLGVMMYEMFTGRPPYQGDNAMAILYQHLEGKATPPCELNPTLTPQLQAVIQKAMAVDPAQRFQSMEELGKHLIPLLRQSAR
jgi:serine/threonine-protein kinase